MKKHLAKVASLFIVTTLSACCTPSAPPNSPCGNGLAPLSAKISKTADGHFTADIFSKSGMASGVPIQAGVGISDITHDVTQCVVPAFAELVVKRPELFNITIDEQSGMQISSKKHIN